MIRFSQMSGRLSNNMLGFLFLFYLSPQVTILLTSYTETHVNVNPHKNAYIDITYMNSNKHVQVHMFMCVFLCVHTWASVPTHTLMYVDYLGMCECVHLYMLVHMFICVRAHTHSTQGFHSFINVSIT